MVGRRAGSSRRQIVIVAARDAALGARRARQRGGHRGADAGRAGATRAARPGRRSCSRRSTARTLGQAGARRLRRGAAGAGPGGRAWSSSRTSARRAAGRPCRPGRTTPPARASPCSAPWPSRSGWSSAAAGGGSGTFGQLARLSFPIGIGAQGVLLDSGLRRGADLGQRGAAAGRQRAAGGRSTRTGWAGWAAQRCRTLTALDNGPAPGARAEELPAGGEPGAAGRGCCRSSRARSCCRCSWRRSTRSPAPAGATLDVLRWLRWLGAWVAPFLAALAVAQFLALVDATPSPPAAPVPPDDLPLDGPALAVLGGVAVAMVLAFFLARWLAARPDPELGQTPDLGRRRRARPHHRGRGDPPVAGEPVRGALGRARPRTSGCSSPSPARCRRGGCAPC